MKRIGILFLSLAILLTLVLCSAPTVRADEGECPHQWVLTKTVPATCTESGFDLYVCALCGALGLLSRSGKRRAGHAPKEGADRGRDGQQPDELHSLHSQILLERRHATIGAAGTKQPRRRAQGQGSRKTALFSSCKKRRRGHRKFRGLFMLLRRRMLLWDRRAAGRQGTDRNA